MVQRIIDELPKSKDVLPVSILENSVLIHGLKGDSTRFMKKDEIQVLRDILNSGSLQSPSRRNLTEEEKLRYSMLRQDDFNRVVFDALNDNSREFTKHYIGSILLILPVSSLHGYVVAEDPYDVRVIDTVSAHAPGGVNIPIDKGVLVIGEDQYEQVKKEIGVFIKAHNLTESTFLAIVPEMFFDRPWEIIEIAKKRIGLSTNVTYIPTTKEEQVAFMRANNVKSADELLYTKPIATKESLG